MIMDVGFVYMGADDKGVFPLGETAGQLIAQAVGLLRGNLAGDKGLADGVGDHIIGPAPPPGLGKVLPLGKQKLRVRDPAVALVAGDQSAAVRLVRVLHIVDDVLNGPAHGPAFASVQGHNAGGGYWQSLPSKETARNLRTVLCIQFSPHRSAIASPMSRMSTSSEGRSSRL